MLGLRGKSFNTMFKKEQTMYYFQKTRKIKDGKIIK